MSEKISGDKVRIDLLLVEKGLATSREKAQALIMAGQVFNGNQRLEKSGLSVSRMADIRVKGPSLAYVSRGGLKLEKGLLAFPVSLENKVIIDIGASTGGFTDCALQNGAARVIAVDVGYGQLDWKLRQDARVKVMEKTNARYLTQEDLGEAVDFVTIDVAFISLSKIFPVLPLIMKLGAQGIALIKPQFEAGRHKVGKKGVVKDPLVHIEVIENILRFADLNNLTALGLNFSPIKGPQGNIEYLFWFGYKTAIEPLPSLQHISQLVEKASQDLRGDSNDQ